MSEIDIYVYIVAAKAAGWDDGPVKVGMAVDVQKRLAGIQTGNPQELHVAAYFAMPTREIARHVERAFHDVMHGKRLRGEWFDLSVAEAARLMCLNIRVAWGVNANLSEDDTEKMLHLSRVAMNEAKLVAMKEQKVATIQ